MRRIDSVDTGSITSRAAGRNVSSSCSERAIGEYHKLTTCGSCKSQNSGIRRRAIPSAIDTELKTAGRCRESVGDSSSSRGFLVDGKACA